MVRDKSQPSKRLRLLLRCEALEDRCLLAALWPVAPVAGDHQMLNGFGQAEPNQSWKFHAGIDILVNGQGDPGPGGARQIVRAARAGKVVRKLDGGDPTAT